MPNNKILGACSDQNQSKIKLFDLSPLLQNKIPTEIYCKKTQHSDKIRSLSFSEDNQLCCCVSADKSLSLFTVDLNSEEKLQQILSYENLHQAIITKVQFLELITLDEELPQYGEESQKIQNKNYNLVTISKDCSLNFKARIGSIKDSKLSVLKNFEKYHKNYIYNLVISKCLVDQPSEKDAQSYLVVTASEDKSLKIAVISFNFNLCKDNVSQKLIKQFATSDKQKGDVYGVQLSSDGRFIISGDGSNTLRVFQNLEHIVDQQQ